MARRSGGKALDLSGLNPPQREAVDTLRGPLLVLAGAGTGKTRVVTYRIAALAASGVPAERILAVTFTNKAAREMKERYRELAGKRRGAEPEISTFHSLCVRILRRHIDRLGYPARFAICDRSDQESAARAALREIRVDGATLRPGDLLAAVSSWKNRGKRPGAAAAEAASDREHLAAAGYRRYVAALKARGAVDFDDLLLLVGELFDRFDDVRSEESGRFDHLLIDEYQDTNGTQYAIAKGLAEVHRNLCVVGDDDQSIYGWRGAEVEHILHFRRDWPDAKVVRLENNYRSTVEILEYSNRLISFNTKRHVKRLSGVRHGEKPRVVRLVDEEDEAKFVVEDITRRMREAKLRPRDFALLLRTNEQPRIFELELRKANLPYVLVGGMSFYDRKEIRDLLAYLKVLDRPDDDASLLRIVNTPARGITQAASRQMMESAAAAGKPVYDVMRSGEMATSVPGAAGAKAKAFCLELERLRGRFAEVRVGLAVAELIEAVGYREYLVSTYSDANELAARLAAVEEFLNSAANYEKGRGKSTLAGFLEEIALGGRDEADEKEAQLDRDAIVLMTLHSAKGLEFREVYLVGMEEGLLPHRRSIEVEGPAIEEERRLCYVGLTRAQRRLTLTLAMQRMKWGKARATIPSRFVHEVLGLTEEPAAKAGLEESRRQMGPKTARVDDESATSSGKSRGKGRGSRGNRRGDAKPGVNRRRR